MKCSELVYPELWNSVRVCPFKHKIWEDIVRSLYWQLLQRSGLCVNYNQLTKRKRSLKSYWHVS